MPGTSAGLKKAWETRRARYGPSGHAPQTVAKSSRSGAAAKSGTKSGTKSSTAKEAKSSSTNNSPSPRAIRNSNKAQRLGTTRDLPPNRDLERAREERESVLKKIRAYDRAKSAGKIPRKVAHNPNAKYQPDQPPAWVVADLNQREAAQHKANQARLRELTEYIRGLEEYLLQQERKKYGRRYN